MVNLTLIQTVKLCGINYPLGVCTLLFSNENNMVALAQVKASALLSCTSRLGVFFDNFLSNGKLNNVKNEPGYWNSVIHNIFI